MQPHKHRLVTCIKIAFNFALQLCVTLRFLNVTTRIFFKVQLRKRTGSGIFSRQYSVGMALSDIETASCQHWVRPSDVRFHNIQAYDARHFLLATSGSRNTS
jgi:hypothetical protein